ncbi:MAG: hypothetical protein FWE09_00130 [Treponema sp.]|nr:hypothetical protein [Treponema sp.]
MEARANEEFHDLLDELAERGFHGELSLYFQAGVAEESKVTERLSKSSARERARRRREARSGKAVAVVRPAKGAPR